jgi:hypothetical protein
MFAGLSGPTVTMHGHLANNLFTQENYVVDYLNDLEELQAG